MPNSIERVQILQRRLDQQIIQEMTTGWMELNASQVQYTGGDEVKIPNLLVDGLGNYDKGYKDGSVTFKFVTKRLTQDRGIRFQLDVRDVDETAGLLNIGTVMNEFQRTQVVPELDSYRLSFLASAALGNAGFFKTGFDPSTANIANKETIKEIKAGIKKIRESGYNGQLVIHANWDVITALELEKLDSTNTVTFKANGVSTNFRQIDDCPIIPTATNRMYSKIKINDGETSFGYEKATDGKTINFIIVGRDVPIAITKLDTLRVFDPMTNQEANGWKADYRRFHDIWVLDSKKNAIYCSVKES